MNESLMSEYLFKNFGPAAVALVFSWVMLKWFMGRLERQDAAKDKYQAEMIDLMTKVIAKNTSSMEGMQTAMTNLTAAVQASAGVHQQATSQLVGQLQILSRGK